MTALAARYGRPGSLGLVLGVPAAILIALAGTLSPTLLLAGALGVALVYVTVANLTLGLVAFTLLTFFERVPGLESFTVTKPFGAVLVISLLITWTRDREQMPALPRDRPLLMFLLAGFVVFAVASMAWAADPGTTASSSLRLALVATMFLVVYSAIRTPRDLLLLAWAYVTGTCLVSTVALATGEWSEGRLTSGALDPNFLAATLVSSSVIALFMLAAVRRLWQQAVLVAFTAVFIVALVLTQSRGGLGAALVALVAAIAFAGRWRARVAVAVLVVASAGIVYYAVLAPASVRERVTSISAGASASRADTWTIAVNAASDRPLGGVGLGNFPLVQREYLPAALNLPRADFVLFNELVVHNTYLEILSELGIVGLGLLAAIIAVSFAAGLHGLRTLGRVAPEVEAPMRGLLAGTVSLLAAYVFLSAQYEKHLWLLLGLLATFPTVARAAHASRPRPRLRSVPADTERLDLG